MREVFVLLAEKTDRCADIGAARHFAGRQLRLCQWRSLPRESRIESVAYATEYKPKMLTTRPCHQTLPLDEGRKGIEGIDKDKKRFSHTFAPIDKALIKLLHI
jgi:hypothetical protein